MRSRF